MFWILFVMGSVVAVVVALLVGGMVTPRHHRVARSIVVNADPDTVWRAVRDVAQYATWRDDILSAVLVDTDQPGVRWRETSRRGSVTFGIVHEHAPHAFTARVLDDDLSYSGEWRWHVGAVAEGTCLAITESADVGNPVFRFVGTHVIGHTRALDVYLVAFARHVGSSGVPIVDALPT